MTFETVCVTSNFDSRFFFHVYGPQSCAVQNHSLPLIVIIHGIQRDIAAYLEGLQKFCQQHPCVLLCPVFPEGVPNPKQKNSYRELVSKNLRFDTILLSMVEQAGQIWQIRTDKFYLHGFSAGGQFVHRFMYLHPDRLAAVSVGAPGRITAPDLHSPWPVGVSNIHSVFSLPAAPNFDQMARIPVQYVIGEKDVGTKMVECMKNPTKFEIEAGGTRVERIKWLKKAWEGVGIRNTELFLVPDVGHDGAKCLPTLEKWLRSQLGRGS